MDKHDEYALADHLDISQWKRLFKYITLYRKDMIILLAAAVATAFFDALFPLMTQMAIADFIRPRQLKGFGRFVVLFVTIKVMFSVLVLVLEQALEVPHGLDVLLVL